MKTPLPLLACILALTLHFAGPLRSADQPIDVERARELFRRAQAGETLTADEQKYLDEAKRRRDAQDGGASPDREKTRAIREKMDRGEKLTEDEQRFADEMRKRMAAGGQPGGAPDEAMREKMRAVREKMEKGEKLTEEEQRMAEGMRRRMEAAGGQQGGGEFTWDKAHAAHAKEQRGDALSDDEKKLLAEARKRFEEGRGPDQPQAPPQKPQGDRPQAKDDFDWQKARAAHEKEQRGEALTSDEKTLLDAAKKRVSEGRGPG